MIRSHSERLSQNEEVFRRLNEQVQEGLDEVNAVAIAHDARPIDFDMDQSLHFYCECSNESCVEQIHISLNDYNTIHQDRMFFTIKPGHEILTVDKVIKELPEYTIVKKR